MIPLLQYGHTLSLSGKKTLVGMFQFAVSATLIITEINLMHNETQRAMNLVKPFETQPPRFGGLTQKGSSRTGKCILTTLMELARVEHQTQ